MREGRARNLPASERFPNRIPNARNHFVLDWPAPGVDLDMPDKEQSRPLKEMNKEVRDARANQISIRDDTFDSINKSWERCRYWRKLHLDLFPHESVRSIGFPEDRRNSERTNDKPLFPAHFFQFLLQLLRGF